MDTFRSTVGKIGDEVISILVPSKSVLDLTNLHARACFKRVDLFRIPFVANKVEFGSDLWKATRMVTSCDKVGTVHHVFIIAAYKCHCCKTTFIVPTVGDLAHACTEPFDAPEDPGPVSMRMAA